MSIGDVSSDSLTDIIPTQVPAGSSKASEGIATSFYTPISKKELTGRALDILNDLRDKGQLCDAVLRVNGTAFPVHRNILSVYSAYFKILFTSTDFNQGNSPQQVQEVELTDVTPEVFKCLVDYAYSRQVYLTEDNVQSIFHAADRFLIPCLVKACCDFLKSRLRSENCLGIAAFARAYFRQGLAKAAMHFAFRHFGSVANKSQEFLELDDDSFFDLISSDYLNVRHEEFVFEAVCRWIQHDPANRKDAMPRMLRGVRLGFLSAKELMEIIKAHDFVRSNDEAKSVVTEALKYVCNLEMRETSLVGSTFQAMAKPRVPYEILFVIGGWSGGSPTDIIETYDSRADHWLVCRPPDGETRAYHGCVAVGQMIYVVGGFNGVEYFNSCRKFNPVTILWSEAPPMNCKRCYVSATALDGKLYAMGGFDGHVRLNSVERLDPKKNQWSFVYPMIQQRSDAKASVLHGKIYICGGFNGQECLNTAEYFDPVINQWTMLTPMRNRRSGVGVVAYLGRIYALGGFNGITRMNTAECYDPVTNAWTSIPDMYSPRSNFAVGVVDGLMFVIGGFNGVTTISQVECYDALANEWFDAAGLSLYRSALCACVVKNVPNVSDYVYRPTEHSLVRQKPIRHLTGPDTQASTSSSTSPHPAGSSPATSATYPTDSLLNQLS